MNIKNDLKNFYDSEAKKYHSSRKKPRSDWKWIIDEINKTWKKEISILEFWCGWWRCINYLDQNLKWVKIKYTWVDLSNELLKLAKKDNPKHNFICDDICHFITKVPQESFDFIIWIASFQHIPSQWERVFLMKHCYKALKYEGKIILVNRALSKRFIKKYAKPIISSIWKTIYTMWKHKRRDILIPRKNRGKEYERFYHMYSKNELNTLIKWSWFQISTLTYLDKHWQITNSRKDANNILITWEKKIFL